MSAVANFLDTNVLVYAFTDDDRAQPAQELLGEPFATSAQALNEFSNVARKTLGMDWTQIADAVEALIAVSAAIVPFDEEMTLAALPLAARYKLSFYDSSMLAAALSAGCERFYTEDLHDGLVIEGSLAVVNPFDPREPAMR